jgi:aryl-alcohol dehydrogenase-like predicted oxidoreductase
MDDNESQRTIEAAMEGGIRFFDTAESYQGGESERRYGKYLVPKYRDDVFIMTKSTARDAETARKHLEGSLKRMNLDQIDLWQVHSLQSPDDVENRINNGVMDVFQEALDSGKVRYIGFTGHADPDAHARMLERQDIFYTAQMPINPIDAAADDSFIKKVVPTVTDRKMALLAMKTLADGRFFARKERAGWTSDNPVVPDHIQIKDSLYFAWSLPVSVLITGPDNADMLREKIQMAKDFSKLNRRQRNKIISRVEQFANGDVEYYKS